MFALKFGFFLNVFVGIGDEDDIQFESDTSQSESEHNSVPTTPQPPSHSQPLTPSNMSAPMTFVQAEPKKNIQNIQISAMPQQTINTASPVVQVRLPGVSHK